MSSHPVSVMAPGTDISAPADRAKPARIGARAWLVVSGIVLMTTLAVSLVISQPAWVVPAWLSAESAEISEASLRLAIVRERQRVEAYRMQHGQLPISLEAAGAARSGVRYFVNADGSYLLEADVGRSSVRLASNGSVKAFLGNSLQVILSRPAG